MSIVGLKFRSAIITLVYRKTLHSSNTDLNYNFLILVKLLIL